RLNCRPCTLSCLLNATATAEFYTLSLHDALPICTDIVIGVVAQPGIGNRVRSGMAAWDPESGTAMPQFTQEIQGLAFLTAPDSGDRKSTRLNSSHSQISYAVFCLKKKKILL